MLRCVECWRVNGGLLVKRRAVLGHIEDGFKACSRTRLPIISNLSIFPCILAIFSSTVLKFIKWQVFRVRREHYL